jgi:hypothetical protein
MLTPIHGGTRGTLAGKYTEQSAKIILSSYCFQTEFFFVVLAYNKSKY